MLYYLNSNDATASVLVQAGLSSTLANRIRDRRNVTKDKLRFWDLENEMNGGFKESDMKTLVKLVTDNGTVTKFKEMRLAAEKAAAEKSFAEKAAAELKKQKENGIVVTPSPIPQFDTNKDPFDPAYCQGEPLSLENAKKAFAGGALVADIGSYKIYRRERTCNSISGCGPW